MVKKIIFKNIIVTFFASIGYVSTAVAADTYYTCPPLDQLYQQGKSGPIKSLDGNWASSKDANMMFKFNSQDFMFDSAAIWNGSKPQEVLCAYKNINNSNIHFSVDATFINKSDLVVAANKNWHNAIIEPMSICLAPQSLKEPRTAYCEFFVTTP